MGLLTFSPWHKNGAKRLPRPVQEYMKRWFTLLPEYLDLLRCFEYDGLVNEKRVKGYIDSEGSVYVADRRSPIMR